MSFLFSPDRQNLRFGSCLTVFMLAAIALVLPVRGQSTIHATEIPRSALIQPEQLEQQLDRSPHAATLIVQVGSRLLFDEAHIPGAVYAGPTSRPKGLEALRRLVANDTRNQPIVIYCGCCPWTRCPNMGPAWRMLQQMGFTDVKALYLADNFGADWVAKGYRVEKSQ